MDVASEPKAQTPPTRRTRSGSVLTDPYLLLGLLLVLAYCSPMLVGWEDTHVLIHDNLDASAALRALESPGAYFAASDTPLPQIMNGLPRGTLGSEFYLHNLLNRVMTPFGAYLTNQVILRVAALLGMYLLLGSIIGAKRDPFLIALAAISFALLPFYVRAGLSVAGLPLTLYALLAVIRREDRALHWAILVLMPFATVLFAAPVFFWVLAAAAWLVDLVRHRRPHWRWLSAMVLAAAMHLICEYRLIVMLLDLNYISHRIDFNPSLRSWVESMALARENLIDGQYHVATYHRKIVAPLALLAGVYLLAVRGPGSVRARQILGLVGGAAVISLFFGFYRWQPVVAARHLLGPLEMIQWDRFHWLHPVLWYLAFGLAIDSLARVHRFARLAVLALVALQIGMLFNLSEFRQGALENKPTFAQFHATGLFAEIQRFIGRDPSTYRVVSLGLHPAVAMYNGFYCLDFYHYDYPIEYKRAFRRVIAKELEKNPKLAEYFDSWGSRCYLFSSELGMRWMWSKHTNRGVQNLELDLDALRRLGGEYIISAVEIRNAEREGLELLGLFEDEGSYWRIRLYSVPPSAARISSGRTRTRQFSVK